LESKKALKYGAKTGSITSFNPTDLLMSRVCANFAGTNPAIVYK
jgi:hypothetical protein